MKWAHAKMGRKEHKKAFLMTKVQLLFEKGFSPYQISYELKIPWIRVLINLYTLVRDGHLRRSDIVFSIPPDKRNLIGSILKHVNKNMQVKQIIENIRNTEAVSLWSSIEEMESDVTVVSDFYYVRERSQISILGEIYADLCDTEVRLFDFIISRLQSEFGKDETEWWVNSVPETIRQECAKRQEQDNLRCPKEAYLNIIYLKEIINKNWHLFQESFAKVNNNPMLKKQLLADLIALNNIRNKVMHPLRKAALTDEDFELVRNFSKKIHVLTKGQIIRWIV